MKESECSTVQHIEYHRKCKQSQLLCVALQEDVFVRFNALLGMMQQHLLNKYMGDGDVTMKRRRLRAS